MEIKHDLEVRIIYLGKESGYQPNFFSENIALSDANFRERPLLSCPAPGEEESHVARTLTNRRQ